MSSVMKTNPKHRSKFTQSSRRQVFKVAPESTKILKVLSEFQDEKEVFSNAA